MLLKIADIDDFEFFYEIKSQKENLYWTGHSTIPEYERLKGWFLQQIESETRKILIGIVDESRAGYMYIDISSLDSLEIAYGISESFSGKGFGKSLISSAIKFIRSNYIQREIKAWIRADNIGSIKTCISNGFHFSGITEKREVNGKEELFLLFTYIINKVIVIAEAGVNHNGNIALAEKLIDAAAEAKADYIKFQTWVTEELVDISAPKAEYQKVSDDNATQFEMLKKLELSFQQFRYLKNYANTKNIKFLSTPDDFKSLDFLNDELNLELIKVGSGEITNIPFLMKIGSKKKEVVLSTGMATLAEVEIALNALISSGAKKVTILHCTSNYPAAFDSVNLKAMHTLKSAFKTDVGYSDHTEGLEVSLAAVAMGATVIEKHFTIDKSLPGPDHKASIDPDELKALVKQIRNIEMALSGEGVKKPHSSEIETKKVVTKGIYLNKDVQQGHIIVFDDLSFKRPVNGLMASQYDLLIGKKMNSDKPKGSPLKLADLS